MHLSDGVVLLMALPRKTLSLPLPLPLELELELDVDGKPVPTLCSARMEASKLFIVWHIHHHAFTIEPNKKYRYLQYLRQSKLGARVERM